MKIERIISIITVLLQNKKISAPSLANQFGVTVRTIYRDIAVIEQAGIPIITYSGQNGGIGILETYKIGKELFTSQDITMLLSGLHSISGTMDEKAMAYAMAKLKALIPEEHSKTVESKANLLWVDMTPWASNPNVEANFKIIKQALNESLQLSFSYSDRMGSKTQRTVESCQLILKEDSWYLKAYCLMREDFRILKLSRITEPVLSAVPFEPREFPSGLNDFKDWTHEKMIVVNLMIDVSLRERMLNYCKEEYFETLGDGKILVQLPFVESEMGYDILLSLGCHCECISPPEIRAELIRRIRQHLEVYKS